MKIPPQLLGVPLLSLPQNQLAVALVASGYQLCRIQGQLVLLRALPVLREVLHVQPLLALQGVHSRQVQLFYHQDHPSQRCLLALKIQRCRYPCRLQ